MKKIAILAFIAFIVSCGGTPQKPVEAFDADKLFAKANGHLDKGEYVEARTTLTEIKSRDITKKYAPLAHLKIADSYLKEGEPELAAEEYRKFTEVYPENKYASYAMYQIALIYYDQIKGPDRGYGFAAKALEEFEKLKKAYPRNPFREAIEMRIEKCKETIVEHEIIIGDFYFKKDAYDAAIKRYLGALKKFPGYKREVYVLYQLGLSYKGSGDNAKAAEYFKSVIEKYPTNDLALDAKNGLSHLKK